MVRVVRAVSKVNKGKVVNRVNKDNRMVKAASKGHLTSTKQQGDGALSVPGDEMALFREFLPGASDAEIQKYYNADRKKFGPK